MKRWGGAISRVFRRWKTTSTLREIYDEITVVMVLSTALVAGVVGAVLVAVWERVSE